MSAFKDHFGSMARTFKLASCSLLLMAGPLVASAAPVPDSKGTDFWLMFNYNFRDIVEKTLFITGDANASGTVEIPGLAFSTPFVVTAGTVTTIPMPDNVEVRSSDFVEAKGIHITADQEVTVYGLSRQLATTDAYLGLPTDVLGTEYIVMAYQNWGYPLGTQFGVVAPQNNTTVTITPTVTTGARAAGVPYTIVLNQGDAYQLNNPGTGFPYPDLTGTTVLSDKPVAVFGGHQCAHVPPEYVACDFIVEQLPPTSAWGNSFLTVPLATRTGGDTFRFLASMDGTEISISQNGLPPVSITLNRGQFHEMLLTQRSSIASNHPILVAQYSNGQEFDGTQADPFMMLVPPFEQFQTGYTVTTPSSGFSVNYINVVAPAAAVGNILLDGSAIPVGSFTAIGGSGFSGAQVPVSLGSHHLSGPSLPFGVFVYGFDTYDSYGYIGGLSLAPIVTVNSLSLAPNTATNPVGSEHCVTATVLDTQAGPVLGVRVDFTVQGANTASASATTDADGHAMFCYTGQNAGTDSIIGTALAFADTAYKTWTSGERVCPLSQGYWKNHEDEWPVTSLTLGTVSYSQADLLQLLKQPVQGDASLILAKQLIAAKLNVANGVQATPVQSELTSADALIGSSLLPAGVNPASELGNDMTEVASTLDAFNNGQFSRECLADVDREQPIIEGFHGLRISGTVAAYYVDQTAPVHLSIFDVTGRKIAQLVDAVQNAGEYQVGWDGRSSAGTRAPQGIYFYRVQIGSVVSVARVAIVR